MTCCARRYLCFICAGLLSWAAAFAAHAQVLDSTSGTLPNPGDVSQNERLRIQLDRTTVHAFEPVYLSVTARRFATDEPPELSVWQGDDPTPQLVQIDEKAWIKGETVPPGAKEAVQRQGVMLQLRAPATGTGPDAKRSYLFPAAGDYNLRVKVGPTAVTMKVKVVQTADRERDAWDALGPQVNDIVYNSINDRPSQSVVDTCARIIRTYRGTECAAYCQVYISVSRFKVAFDQSGKGGGKEVYEPLAKELARVNKAFADTFMGEQTGFYAAYAAGLTRDYNGLLAISEGVKTHVTPFSDGLDAMRAEVARHVMPNVVPVDPTTLPAKPTTAPAAK